jgi:hypothetical protein
MNSLLIGRRNLGNTHGASDVGTAVIPGGQSLPLSIVQHSRTSSPMAPRSEAVRDHRVRGLGGSVGNTGVALALDLRAETTALTAGGSGERLVGQREPVA